MHGTSDEYEKRSLVNNLYFTHIKKILVDSGRKRHTYKYY